MGFLEYPGFQLFNFYLDQFGSVLFICSASQNAEIYGISLAYSFIWYARTNLISSTCSA